MSKILIDEATVKLVLGALNELVAQTEIGLFAVRHDHVAMQDARQAITALKALAEQPAQQEPVSVEHCVWARNGNSPCPHTTPQPAQQEPKAWMNPNASFVMDAFIWTRDEQNHPEYSEPVYTTPQPAQRTWVGLTRKELDEWTPEIHSVIQAIEAQFKEKNT